MALRATGSSGTTLRFAPRSPPPCGSRPSFSLAARSSRRRGVCRSGHGGGCLLALHIHGRRTTGAVAESAGATREAQVLAHSSAVLADPCAASAAAAPHAAATPLLLLAHAASSAPRRGRGRARGQVLGVRRGRGRQETELRCRSRLHALHARKAGHASPLAGQLRATSSATPLAALAPHCTPPSPHLHVALGPRRALLNRTQRWYRHALTLTSALPSNVATCAHALVRPHDGSTNAITKARGLKGPARRTPAVLLPAQQAFASLSHWKSGQSSGPATPSTTSWHTHRAAKHGRRVASRASS